MAEDTPPQRGALAKARRLLSLSPGEAWRLGEATSWLIGASVLVSFMPIRWWHRLLGTQVKGAPVTQEGGPLPTTVAGCARWITTAANHLPWRPLCLPQAVALRWMLRRRGYRPIVVLGVRRQEGKRGVDAHAWLVEGERVAIGGDIKPFSVLCHFT